jgi:hypothetical protein
MFAAVPSGSRSGAPAGTSHDNPTRPTTTPTPGSSPWALNPTSLEPHRLVGTPTVVATGQTLLAPDVSPEGSAAGDSRTPANSSHVSQSTSKAEGKRKENMMLPLPVPSVPSTSSLSLVCNFTLTNVLSYSKWLKVWRSCRNFT